MFELTIGGDVDSFNTSAYATGIALLLTIDPTTVYVNVRLGSVVVLTTIHVESAEHATAIISSLVVTLRNTTTAAKAFGLLYPIERFTPPVFTTLMLTRHSLTPPSPSPANSSIDSGLSALVSTSNTTLIVSLTLTGLFLILILSTLACVLHRRHFKPARIRPAAGEELYGSGDDSSLPRLSWSHVRVPGILTPRGSGLTPRLTPRGTGEKYAVQNADWEERCAKVHATISLQRMRMLWYRWTDLCQHHALRRDTKLVLYSVHLRSCFRWWSNYTRLACALDLKLTQIKQKLGVDENNAAITAEVLAGMVPIEGTVNQKIWTLHERLMSTRIAPARAPIPATACFAHMRSSHPPSPAVSPASCPYAPRVSRPAVGNAVDGLPNDDRDRDLKSSTRAEPAGESMETRVAAQAASSRVEVQHKLNTKSRGSPSCQRRGGTQLRSEIPQNDMQTLLGIYGSPQSNARFPNSVSYGAKPARPAPVLNVRSEEEHPPRRTPPKLIRDHKSKKIDSTPTRASSQPNLTRRCPPSLGETRQIASQAGASSKYLGGTLCTLGYAEASRASAVHAAHPLAQSSSNEREATRRDSDTCMTSYRPAFRP